MKLKVKKLNQQYILEHVLFIIENDDTIIL
jgi:hypothetical protein